MVDFDTTWTMTKDWTGMQNSSDDEICRIFGLQLYDAVGAASMEAPGPHMEKVLRARE